MDMPAETGEDPLIVALPPATDYMTYLTLLEYQLTPNNLSTLNRLLVDDDGTLAAEIGWDVLRLVLPMLQIVPEEAGTCLSIIARRGNPREVVVRVAEELERLGQQENESILDEEELDQDGLPTFAGEAPRVHLGEMQLSDTPPSAERARASDLIETVPSERRHSIGGEPGSDNTLFLQALLSMLSILHPRIKTQFPSRFLATSLPAALAAYRRIRVTPETTLAFIDLLSILSGKQRPALPPRTSTASSIPTARTTFSSATIPASDVRAPPLPDPEAKPNSGSGDLGLETNEKAINQRLLQAVMLEVLDEYTGSFETTDFPSMRWTARLRERHEARRVLPQRPTETQRWSQSDELKSRDEVLVKFLNLAKNLDLDTTREIVQLAHPANERSSDPINDGDEEDEASDYPTSPAQIPFPTSGLILLFAALNFAQDTTGLTQPLPLTLEAVQRLFQATFAPPQDLPHPPSLAQTDALLSLAYSVVQSLILQPDQSAMQPNSSVIDLPFLTSLTNLFATSPDSSVRDSTHHLTGLLLHHYTSTEVKLLYIKSLLSPYQSPASLIHDIQQGNIRALAINWLKDEFLSYSDTTVEPAAAIPVPTVTLTSSSANSGLNPNLMHSDPDLASLVFPALPAPPSPFITGHPGATSTPTQVFGSSDSDLENLLLMIPCYISVLNLICILAALPSAPSSTQLGASQEHTHQDDDEREFVLGWTPIAAPASGNKSDASSRQKSLLSRASEFLDGVTMWKNLLLGLAEGAVQRTKPREGLGTTGPVSLTDVYALEDAVGRAEAVMMAHKEVGLHG